MTAERFRMDVISSNIANANSIKIGNQEPYRRKTVQVATTDEGVQITKILDDQSPFRKVYEPGNPNAVDGYVTCSNIEPLQEMVSMMTATRAYEANIAAFNSAKGMIRSALSIGKV
jgi:flagellar basal-body rod protein FlgC